MDHPSPRLRELAFLQMDQGNDRAAVESWRQILTVDPDDGQAHALLSICLVRTKRLHAAELEAGLALASDAQQAEAHHAMGVVRLAQRRFKPAREHFEQALQLSPESTGTLLNLAALHQLEDRETEARRLLERALEIDPEDPDVIVRLGEVELAKGNLRRADERAKEALAISAEHQGGLVLAGRVLLQRGQVEEAREHALWALRDNPSSSSALRFLSSVKARQSKLLGLWWRYSVWMSRLGSTAGIALLVGAFFTYRVVNILLEEFQRQQFADLVQYAWLAIVAYTWFAPALFDRMIKRELESVRLKPGF